MMQGKIDSPSLLSKSMLLELGMLKIDHIQKPLKDLLDQRVLEEISENVQDGEEITCCVPLVVQPKPKFTEMKSE